MAGTSPDATDLSGSGHGQLGAPLPAAPSSSSPLPPPWSSLEQPAFPSSISWAPSPWQQPVFPSSLPAPLLPQPAGSASFSWHDPWQPQQHDIVTPELRSFGQFDFGDDIFSDPMFRDLLLPAAAALEQPAIPQHDASTTTEYLESGCYDHLDDPSFFRAMTHDLQPDTQTTAFLNQQLGLGAPAMAMAMQGLTDQNGYYWGQGPVHWQASASAAAAAEAPAVHAAPYLAADLPDAPPPADPPNPPAGRRPRGRPRGSTAAKSRSRAKPKLATMAAEATPEPCHEQPMSTEQPAAAASTALADAGEEEEAVGGTSGAQGAQQQEEEEEEEDEAVEYADTNLPGVRFQPTDEEIIGYLCRKYHGRRMPADIVRDFNVFQDHPSTVKENFGDSIDGAWYVFSPRDRRYSRGKRPARSVYKGDHKIGYWKSNTGEESIIVRGKVIGSVNNLTFALGQQPHGEPTPWKIREYRIPDFQRKLLLGPKQRYPKQRNLDPHPTPLDDWVIYKLFYKEKKAKRKVAVDVEVQQAGEVGEDADEEEDDDKDDDASDGNPSSDG